MHGSYSSGRITKPQSQDRTLTVQDKAPIRSQALSPMMLGERLDQVDGSTQRQLRQSQHGSDSAGVRAHRRLSVPTIRPSAHRLNHSIIFDELSMIVTGILAAAVRMHDQSASRFAPPVRRLQRLADQLGFHP